MPPDHYNYLIMKSSLTFITKLTLLLALTKAQTDQNNNICQYGSIASFAGVQQETVVIDDNIPGDCSNVFNCMTISVGSFMTLDLGEEKDLSTIVFLSDNAGGANEGGTRRYGTSSDPDDTITNKEVTQFGGTNYASQFADINYGGKIRVQYIHWLNTSTQEIAVREILCYEKKRLYKSEFLPSQMSLRPYIQQMNGPILDEHCMDEVGEGETPGEKTNLEFSPVTTKKVWRVVVIDANGGYGNNWVVVRDHPDHSVCTEDQDNHGWDCYDIAVSSATKLELLFTGSIPQVCTLIALEEDACSESYTISMDLDMNPDQEHYIVDPELSWSVAGLFTSENSYTSCWRYDWSILTANTFETTDPTAVTFDSSLTTFTVNPNYASSLGIYTILITAVKIDGGNILKQDEFWLTFSGCYWDMWKPTEIPSPYFFVYTENQDIDFYPALRSSNGDFAHAGCDAINAGWTTEKWNTEYLPAMEIVKGSGLYNYANGGSYVHDPDPYDYSGDISDHMELTVTQACSYTTVAQWNSWTNEQAWTCGIRLTLKIKDSDFVTTGGTTESGGLWQPTMLTMNVPTTPLYSFEQEIYLVACKDAVQLSSYNLQFDDTLNTQGTNQYIMASVQLEFGPQNPIQFVSGCIASNTLSVTCEWTTSTIAILRQSVNGIPVYEYPISYSDTTVLNNVLSATLYWGIGTVEVLSTSITIDCQISDQIDQGLPNTISNRPQLQPQPTYTCDATGTCDNVRSGWSSISTNAVTVICNTIGLEFESSFEDQEYIVTTEAKTYIIPQAIEIEPASACQITYSYSITPALPDESTVSFDPSSRTFIFNDQALLGLSLSSTSVLSPFETQYTVKVQAQANTFTTDDTEEHSFILTIKNPCVQVEENWINIPNRTLEEVEYTISTETMTIEGIPDQFTVQNPLCGTIELIISVDAASTPVSFQDNIFKVYSTDETLADTTQIVIIYAQLVTYPTTVFKTATQVYEQSGLATELPIKFEGSNSCENPSNLSFSDESLTRQHFELGQEILTYALPSLEVTPSSCKITIEISTDQVLPAGVSFDYPEAIDESDNFVTEFTFTEESNSQMASNLNAAGGLLEFIFKVVAKVGNIQIQSGFVLDVTRPNNLTEDKIFDFSSMFTWEDEDPAELKVTSQSISVLSLLTIHFDHDLAIPNVYKNLTQDNFDDMIEQWLSLNVGSFNYEQNQEEIAIYDYRLVSFINNTIEIQVNFTHPELLSLDKVQAETLRITFTQQLRGESGELQVKDEVLVMPIPQLFTVEFVQEIEAIRENMAGPMTTFSVVNLLIGITAGSGLKHMWKVINVLQFVVYYPLWQITIPLMAEITLVEFKKLAYFEFLKELVFTDQVKEKLGSNSFFENAGVMALGIIVLLVALVLLTVLFVIGLRYEVIRGAYNKIKKILFWNTFIRYVLQSTLKLQMSACAVILIANEVSTETEERRRLQDEDSDNNNTLQVVMCTTILAVLNIVPMIFICVLKKNKESLKTEQTRLKYGSMYQTIQPIDKRSLSYPIVFLLRRSLFVALTYMLYDYPTIQILIQVQTTIAYIVYIQTTPMYDGPLARQIECLNEVLFLIINYHLVFFIQKWKRIAVDSVSAWTLIACIAVLMISNLIVIISGCTQSCKHKLRLKTFKKNRVRIIEEHVAAINDLRINYHFYQSMQQQNPTVLENMYELRDQVVNLTINRFDALGKTENMKEVFEPELLNEEDLWDLWGDYDDRRSRETAINMTGFNQTGLNLTQQLDLEQIQEEEKETDLKERSVLKSHSKGEKSGSTNSKDKSSKLIQYTQHDEIRDQTSLMHQLNESNSQLMQMSLTSVNAGFLSKNTQELERPMPHDDNQQFAKKKKKQMSTQRVEQPYQKSKYRNEQQHRPSQRNKQQKRPSNRNEQLKQPSQRSEQQQRSFYQQDQINNLSTSAPKEGIVEQYSEYKKRLEADDKVQYETVFYDEKQELNIFHKYRQVEEETTAIDKFRSAEKEAAVMKEAAVVKQDLSKPQKKPKFIPFACRTPAALMDPVHPSETPESLDKDKKGKVKAIEKPQLYAMSHEQLQKEWQNVRMQKIVKVTYKMVNEEN